MLVTLEFDTDGKTNDEIFNEIAVLQTILDALTDIDDDFKISVKQAANVQSPPWKPQIYGGGIRVFDEPTLISNAGGYGGGGVEYASTDPFYPDGSSKSTP